ncbi:MAG: hypothetical protein ACRDD4_12440 [Culicoidibacterales bacterium]
MNLEICKKVKYYIEQSQLEFSSEQMESMGVELLGMIEAFVFMVGKGADVSEQERAQHALLLAFEIGIIAERKGLLADFTGGQKNTMLN